MPDYTIEPHGSIILVRPLNQDARDFLIESTADAIWYSGALVVEPRYLDGLIHGFTDAGFTVER